MRNPQHPRRWAAVLAALLTTMALSSCGGAGGDQARLSANPTGSTKLSDVTLTIGDQKGGSHALLAAAGELDRLPYDVRWKEFTSGPPLLEALNAGAIQVGGVGNTPPLFAAAAHSSMVVIAGDTIGGRGDAIVVQHDSPIRSVADLDGKSIAVAKGSSANYHVLAQLEKSGLSFDDVEVQYLQPADALAAFSSGHVDAWATWDPYTAQAELDQHARVIAEGRGVVNGLVFQAAHPEALQDKATVAAIRDYLERLARAKVWSNQHRAEWAEVWAEETGLPVAVTRRAVDRRLAQPVAIDDSVVASEQEMVRAFVEAGLLPEEFDVSSSFTSRFDKAVLAAAADQKENAR